MNNPQWIKIIGSVFKIEIISNKANKMSFNFGATTTTSSGTFGVSTPTTGKNYIIL